MDGKEENNDSDSNDDKKDVQGSIQCQRWNSLNKKVSLRSEKSKHSLMLPREQSMELDSPRDIAEFRSPRNIMFNAPPQPRIQPNASDRSMTQMNMSSIDLEDVEVFRLNSTTERLSKAHSELDQQGFDSSSGARTSNDDLFANMMCSGDSMVNLFSSHIGGMLDPNFNVDCGNCGQLEIRVRGIEMQLDELRRAVETAGALNDKSASPKRPKSWKDRLFGAEQKPTEEREKLFREMEALLKAVNFMLRKMDEVKVKCQGFK